MPPCTCDRPMTYLELINAVLVRLREPEVTTAGGSKYTKLIGALVNDAKRAVEDAAPWTGLFDTVAITTSSGVADYALTDTNERATVFSVIDDTNRAQINRSNARDLIKLKQLETGNGRPAQWAIVGLDSSGQLNLRLYPTPDGARDYSVNCAIPGSDLVNGTDTISVPAEPVFLRAYAYAIKERGEDNGERFSEALDQYRRTLSRYLILNNSANGGSGQWRVL